MIIARPFLQFLTAALMIATGFFFSGSARAGEPPVDTDKLLQQTAAIHPVKRDDFLQRHLSRIISGKGIVLSIDSLKRYGMEYRVIIEEREARKDSMRFRYYLFMTAGQRKNLKPRKNAVFEFQGILSAYTPLNTGRTGYILDIVLSYDRVKTN